MKILTVKSLYQHFESTFLNQLPTCYMWYSREKEKKKNGFKPSLMQLTKIQNQSQQTNSIRITTRCTLISSLNTISLQAIVIFFLIQEHFKF